MREIHDEATLTSFLGSATSLANVVVQNLDLRPHAAKLRALDVRDGVLLGCLLEPNDLADVVTRGALVFPRLDGLPYEPQIALTDGVAGGDGLACIRAIIAGAPEHLEGGGWLLIEHGYDQAVKVRELLAATGFAAISSTPDTAGIERVSRGRWRRATVRPPTST